MVCFEAALNFQVSKNAPYIKSNTAIPYYLTYICDASTYVLQILLANLYYTAINMGSMERDDMKKSEKAPC